MIDAVIDQSLIPIDIDEDQLYFKHPFQSRYATGPMRSIWSPYTKAVIWRKLWLELAIVQSELGLDQITAEALRQMKAAVYNINADVVAAYERELKHDVMAHIKAYAKAAPAASAIIHLGATSSYVTDNADLIIMRSALKLLLDKTAKLISCLGGLATKYKDLPTLGYTHLQPAQPITLGKRIAAWCQDFVIDLDKMNYECINMQTHGLKGATGSQASFMALFNNDEKKVVDLEQRVASRIGGSPVITPGTASSTWGFETCTIIANQSYSRKIDANILMALAGLAITAHKTCNDIRIAASFRELEEPITESQVGSSAMPYKQNPVLCERITGLSRHLITLANSAMLTAAEQWFERTLDDSSNRRITLPEAFLTADVILDTLLTVVNGLRVHPAIIHNRLMNEMPFLITEDLLMHGVNHGANRQLLHTVIQKHCRTAAHNIKAGLANTLIDDLKSDPAFTGTDFDSLLDPAKRTGRCAAMVEEFIIEVVEPIRKEYKI